MVNIDSKNEDVAGQSEKILALCKQVRNGDQSAEQQLRELLVKSPQAIRLLGGILMGSARRDLIDKIVGKDSWGRILIEAHMSRIETELLGTNPEPLKRMLVDQIILCSLELYRARREHTRSLNADLRWRRFSNAQLEGAQRQFNAAVKSLLALTPKLQSSSGKSSINLQVLANGHFFEVPDHEHCSATVAKIDSTVDPVNGPQLHLDKSANGTAHD